MARGPALLAQKIRQITEPETWTVDVVQAFDPASYIREQLGWSPWSGTHEQPGQQQILDAYVLAIRQQLEKNAFEAGQISLNKLVRWQPGQAIRNIIRIEAGHTVGKTKLLSGIVNHFFDSFIPCVGYCFAPTAPQVHDLLFKEIKSDRRDKGLPGEILDLELRRSDNHFIKGKATNNTSQRGTERAQGQHGKYNLYILDEAEGIDQFVFSAIQSMTSGGISIVLMAANPRTRTSYFHKMGAHSNVANFRISCLNHPNVAHGREIIPGAVKRDYVMAMVAENCRQVEQHNPDEFTFELPWESGRIYEPNTEFLFRVLGIAPTNISDKNLIAVGRFEAAVRREPVDDLPRQARIGVDVARFGKDFGTVYVRWNNRVWRAGKLAKLDTVEYYQFVKSQALRLHQKGVVSLHVRVDGGGGFGGGVIDQLRIDDDLINIFPDYQVFECQFGGSARESNKYYDAITEWTADVGETLKSISIIDAPNELQEDICEREYRYRNRGGKQVRKLEEKIEFRNRIGRSPDDGDGFTLALASDFLIQKISDNIPPDGISGASTWTIGADIDIEDDGEYDARETDDW